MSKAMRQMPAKAGRTSEAGGEAANGAGRDEAGGPLHGQRGMGPAQPLAAAGSLLEEALARENLQRAWKRVRANKGAAGVDGLDIGQTHEWLRSHWPKVRQALLQGRYRPQPVRRVMIPKADGSQRELGIPTVLDRLIQQALLQVLQPIIDPSFSDHSYGFR
ncbi:MAG TPA: group II intron reverse transcriptase/maturase, partial [Ramlibacter sp.]|nr:group II intron reverse transcriptase/maturase [Ramlibacter sp.]